MEHPASKTTTETVLPAQEQTKKPKAHLPAIDGLRGLAAMMVVFVHCWGMTYSLHSPEFAVFGVTVPLYRIFTPCYSGVYLFFVLSGFCLAYPFFANPDRPDNWPGYVLNRVRRIMPAYVISFVILFLIGQWLHQVDPSQKFLFETFKTKKFIHELFLIKKSRIVGSYWTLVLEWRWYLIFPALLMVARRFSPVLVLVAVSGFAYLSTQMPALGGALNTATFFLLVIFLPLFALGIWAAQLSARDPEALHPWERWLVNHSLLGVAAGVLWCVALQPSIYKADMMYFVTSWGPFYFFLILASLNQPWFRRIFSSAPFVKLGTISYSTYLLQEPIIRFGQLYIDQPDHSSLRLLSTHYLVLPALCVLAGWGFYHIGERPFLKRRAK